MEDRIAVSGSSLTLNGNYEAVEFPNRIQPDIATNSTFIINGDYGAMEFHGDGSTGNAATINGDYGDIEFDGTNSSNNVAIINGFDGTITFAGSNNTGTAGGEDTVVQFGDGSSGNTANLTGNGAIAQFGVTSGMNTVSATGDNAIVFAACGGVTVTMTGNNDYTGLEGLGNTVTAANGTDLVWYSMVNLTVDLGAGTATQSGSSASDALEGVSDIGFSAINVTFTAGPGNDTLNGQLNGGTVTSVSGGALALASGTTLINISVVSNGNITIGNPNAPATINIGGTTYLLRPGAVTLSDNAGNAIIGNGQAGTLVNVHNTISGAGTIGDGNLSVINRSSAIIDATGTNPLTLTGAGIGNAGLVEASGSGGVVVDTTFSNRESEDPGTMGTLAVAAGSVIDLGGGSVIGGTVSIAANASLTVEPGAASTISGASIADAGSIAVGTAASPATLDIGGTTYLMSGGTVVMSDNAGNAILGNGQPGSLINVHDTISGAGTIGDANLAVVNQSEGVIDATGNNPLILAGSGIASTGLVEATGSGGLVIETAFSTNGTISAAGGSIVDLAGGSVAGGTTYLMNGGTVVMSDNAGNAILGNGQSGTLINVRTTISGAGTIGDANLSIHNEGAGWIEATGANPLTVAGAGIENEGWLVANGGTLVVSTPVTGNGGGGFVESGSTLEFGASVAAGQTLYFQGAGGRLVLDQSTAFAGKIGGFSRGETIDLGDLPFSGNPYVSGVRQSGSDTFVSIADGSSTVTLDLLNQAAGASYALSADHRSQPGTLLAIA